MTYDKDLCDKMVFRAPEDMKLWCKQQPGGASRYIRRLVEDDRKKRERSAAIAVTSNKVPEHANGR